MARTPQVAGPRLFSVMPTRRRTASTEGPATLPYEAIVEALGAETADLSRDLANLAHLCKLQRARWGAGTMWGDPRRGLITGFGDADDALLGAVGYLARMRRTCRRCSWPWRGLPPSMRSSAAGRFDSMLRAGAARGVRRALREEMPEEARRLERLAGRHCRGTR